MNCQDALNLLYDVIDKEASEIDVKEVQKHLDHCQDCLKKFQVEESLRLLVKERLKAVSDIPKIDRLKDNVLAKLEEVDRALNPSAGRTIPFRMPAIALAAAAALILLIGASYWGMGLYNHYVEYIPLERAHWEAAANQSSFADAESTESVIKSVNGDLGLTMNSSLNGLSLVGARTEEIKGQKASHFLYSNGNQMVSAMVFAADSFVLPEDLMDSRVEIDGQCHYDHNCRGCRLVFSKEGRAMIVTATTDHSFGLLEFAPVTATGVI